MTSLLCSLIFSTMGFSQAQMMVAEGPPNEPPYIIEEEELQEVGEEPAVIPSGNSNHRTVLKKDANGKQFIQHPLSKKGLQLIDKDGTYYYATEPQSRRDQFSVIRLGAIDPGPDIQAADGTTYASMYGSGSPFTFFFDYEWKPLQFFGELGLQAGLGIFSAQGNGRFADGTGEAREKYTFYAVPLSLGAVYRFQYTDRQWVAPYLAGGLMYFALAEIRDDNDAPNFVGTPTAYGGGGLLINMSMIDKASGFALDAEYGIRTLWMTLEARQIQASSQDLNLTGTFFSLGFGADY